MATPPPEAAAQTQFLDVITRDEATARFRKHLHLAPLGSETVALSAALGRVLAHDVVATVDVPGFDRSNVDGFAIVASDSFGAMEERPQLTQLNPDVLAPGVVPVSTVVPGHATPIATGGMLPRGADAVLMIEYSDIIQTQDGNALEIRRPVTPGENVSYAGTDIARGETARRAGTMLTSREIGVVAALGLANVDVYRRPRVAIFSTGNEIVAPGAAARPGTVYDSNAAIIGAAVQELGCEPVQLGVVRDDESALANALERALSCDVVIFSGGTSKGAGDISYRTVGRLQSPGVVAHGVALKPGKPICLAVTDGKPVVILPGFPTSAIFTFHEFVAPVLRAFAGLPVERTHSVKARLPMRLNSERGRTEYLLVGLVQSPSGLAAYPMGKGSGSVTAFSNADGFITIDQHTEMLDADSTVEVQLLGRDIEAADLVVIGSHCVGLDLLLGILVRQGIRAKSLYVGSMGGVAAARRGECDIAGVHLLDPATGAYNRHLLDDNLALVPGYGRMQGFVFRTGDARFEGRTTEQAIAAALADPSCVMVNRNAGSGTRILIDQLLGDARPPGYGVQTKSHNAVAAAVAQNRADWGIAIDTVARQYGLGFIPYQEERYDFIVPKARLQTPAVRAFRALLEDAAVRERLRDAGFNVSTS
jgi:molybdopterin molybdotransferase/putative molybdopterin biosynthesis protein